MLRLNALWVQASIYSIFFAFSPLKLNGAEYHVPPLASVLPAKSGTEIVTPERLLSYRVLKSSVSTVKWINNTQLIYTFPDYVHAKEPAFNLYDLKKNQQKPLNWGAMPLPSPDGQWIAFVKGASESKQLWVMKKDQSIEQQVSYVSEGLGVYNYSYGFIWTPDSKNLILEHQPYTDPWQTHDRPKSKIDIINIASGETKQLAEIDATIRHLTWLSKSNEILFVKERTGFQYNTEIDNEWVQALNIQNSHIRTLLYFEGLQQFLEPTPSPNGKLVALLYDVEHPTYTFMLSIGLISSSSDSSQSISPSQVTKEMKVLTVLWNEDNNSLIVKRKYGAYAQLYQVDVSSGEYKALTNEPYDIEDYAVSPDGKQIAWIGRNAHDELSLRVAFMCDFKIWELDRLVPFPEEMALSEVREIEWKTPDYPVKMRGLLTMPLNYVKGKQYPLIVDIHGGGAGADLDLHFAGGMLVKTPLEWQMWAAKGYAVFAPEFRSSANFGSLAISRDLFEKHDSINGDLKDINAGVESLIHAGIVDPQRMAIIGHSAGARRANWFTAVDHHYKAIVSKEGWADEYTDALNNPPSKLMYLMFGGSPQEVPENYKKNSPLYYGEHASTPTLFLMGNPEKGGADPYVTVKSLYNILLNLGIEVEYIDYPDEGHVFEKELNVRDSLNRAIHWINKHLGS